MYKNTKSLCCTSETNIINQLYSNKEYINTIFKRTYVKLPNIVVNFSPAKSAKLNPFAINLYETNPVYNIKGVTCSNLYHSSKVADINSVDISLASNMIADAKKIKIVFLHELMHAIFGFEDVYNPSKRKSTIIYGEYEKDNISVLSLNDVFIINALSWQKDLDEKQKLEIKAFYENYEKYIQNFMSLNQDLER